MNLTSVNIGTPQPIDGKSGLSGIFKTPQSDPVEIGPLGLAGDAIIDAANHGGTDQAVYVYGQPDYSWWAQELSRDLPPGTFGENLTISELHSANCCIGDRFHIGKVILEVTSPRIPCVTLATRMGDSRFPKRFLKAKRPGVYCRVITSGFVSVGTQARLEPFANPRIPITDMLIDWANPSPERMRLYLQTPVHHKSRADYETKLKSLNNSA